MIYKDKIIQIYRTSEIDEVNEFLKGVQEDRIKDIRTIQSNVNNCTIYIILYYIFI